MQSGPLADHDMLAWRSAVITGHTWLVGSGWQGRSEQLFALAGEVERKLAGK